MKNKNVSIIIRSRNEKAKLEELLKSIQTQETIGSLEIIVVDTESNDGSREIIEEYGAKTVAIKQSEFNYPKANNIGVSAAKSEIIIITVSHALPISNKWIKAAMKHFEDDKVAGVYSPCLADREANLFEKCIYGMGYYFEKIKGVRCIHKVGMGVFGATNIALRRELWSQHPFDERYGMGGEDTEWADWAIKQGYKIILDPAFTVRHSHNLGPIKYLRQFILWSKMKRPLPFEEKRLVKRYD